MCLCDGPIPDIYDSVVRKAAKQHTCCECGKPIRSGEYYEYVSGLWDGQWGQYKTCASCVQIRDLLSEETDCCLSHGNMFFEFSHSDFPGLLRAETVADTTGGAYQRPRANACSIAYAKLQPKLYGKG